MQILDGQPVYSATDLVGFLACDHLTDLERCKQLGLVEKPERSDPELEIIIKRGFEHEKTYIDRLRAAGREVRDVSSERSGEVDRGEHYRAQAAATREAIERGDDVIFQACFFDGTWLGFADFLLRVDDPYAPLGWAYEVADTKLAHSVKAGALLQICVYNEMLEAIQGVYPERMHVALGGREKATQAFRTADFRAYFRAVRRRFLEHVAGPDPVYPPPSPSYPEPVEHCAVCSWDEVCRGQRRRDDHLSLVANITARTRASLVERAVGTRRSLAGLALPMAPPLEGTRPEVLARVQRQARLQVQGEDEQRLIYELLAPHVTDDGALDTTKGLLALPEPSPGDLYLDLEGDPFIGDDGMDYLFGLLEPSKTDQDGEPLFRAFWSRDASGEVTAAGEKAAFEACVDRIMAAMEEDPGLHVYHYAPYEPSHFKQLMGRYNTRQDEVDRLLRGGTLVDLYQVVRQGLLASVESYSIKRLEPFYGFERDIELRAAGDSIVEFEQWMELGGHGEGVGQEILDQIEAYNRDDVVSTLKLHRWLETLRGELAAQRGEVLPRPEVRNGEPDQELAQWLQKVQAVAEPLTQDIPADATPDDLSDDQRSRLLLADVLGWHRREQKPEWWAYFSQLELAPDEMIEAREPLGGLEPMGTEDVAARTYRYRFPPQEFEIGDSPVDPANQKTLPVEELADDRDEIVLRFPRGREIEHPGALVPKMIIPTPGHEQRLLDIGSYVIEHGLEGGGAYRAARDMLRRRTPRVVDHIDGEPLRHEGESAGEAAKRLVKELDHTCLAIQGPPGSGKTWIGGRMILELVRQGKTVGVTASSHKVIGNLLDNVWDAQDDYPEFAEREVRIAQKPSSKKEPTCGFAQPIGDAKHVAAAFLEHSVDVVGGT
ncbi:MAG: TM0106 family RecB-like putative nuclease, partial [Candidatus Limnocylindrales bacterium]